jgi:hypothetical protein
MEARKTRKLAVAYIQYTERLKKTILRGVALHNCFRETEHAVNAPVSHCLVLK